MKQRSLPNQHLMLQKLIERFDAVDVTGLSAFERARAIHGTVDLSAVVEGERSSVWTASGPSVPSPSTSVRQDPLFAEEEAA